jgi:uncharacterized membrane protein
MTAGSPRSRLAAEEWLFLAGSLLAGLAYLVLFPPLSIADETLHFYRAAGLAAGEVVPPLRGGAATATVPAGVARVVPELGVGEVLPLQPRRRLDPRVVRSALEWPLGKGEPVVVGIHGTGMYPFVAHLAPATGIAAGRWLDVSPLLLVYLGRLSNLLLSTALTWLAIRASPGGRWALVLLALTPMAVTSRGSLSADAMTTALGFLLLSLVARLAWSPETRPRDRWLLLAVSVALCLTKLPYALLLLTLVVVPRERLGWRRWRSWWLLFLGLAGTAIAFTVWSAARLEEPARPGADAGRQVEALAAAPADFVSSLVADWLLHADRYAAQLVGIQLGWLDVQLAAGPVIAYLALVLGLLLLARGAPTGLLPWHRALALAVGTGVAVTVSASQLVVWTLPGAIGIDGIQGRYFLPAVPLAVWVLARRGGRELPPVATALALAAAYSALTVYVCSRVAARYWA